MGKKENIETQIRLGKELYEYVKTEAERLGVSMNYAINGLLDDGRRFRSAEVIVRMSE